MRVQHKPHEGPSPLDGPNQTPQQSQNESIKSIGEGSLESIKSIHSEPKKSLKSLIKQDSIKLEKKETSIEKTPPKKPIRDITDSPDILKKKSSLVREVKSQQLARLEERVLPCLTFLASRKNITHSLEGGEWQALYRKGYNLTELVEYLKKEPLAALKYDTFAFAATLQSLEKNAAHSSIQQTIVDYKRLKEMLVGQNVTKTQYDSTAICINVSNQELAEFHKIIDQAIEKLSHLKSRGTKEAKLLGESKEVFQEKQRQLIIDDLNNQLLSLLGKSYAFDGFSTDFVDHLKRKIEELRS